MRLTNTKGLYPEARTCFFALLSVLLFIVLLYVYFVSASVVHVVMRIEASQEIAKMSSYISQLEADYIEAQHTMSNDIASMQGFVVTEEKIFIDKTEATLVLSRSTDS